MKKENTATRLKQIMSSENLRQVDILTKTMPYCEKYDVKMNKSDLSQYCSGKTEPNQDKLFVLSLALNVNEAWLMGFNVPMKRDNYEDQKVITHDAIWDEVEELLQQAGYHIVDSDENDIVTVTNSKQEIICSVHVYELVSIYENLMKKGSVTAQALIAETAAGWQKIDSYFYGKEASDEIYQKLAKNILRFQGKQKDLNEIYLQLSNDNQERVLTYSKSLLSTQQLDDELLAAHARTDIEDSPENQQRDLDLMDDDSKWE